MTRAPGAGAGIEPSLTDTLCTRCGLCCDGTLLADVELAGRAEAARVELLGLRVDEDADAPVMALPCAALRGTRCSVYAHRPRCCRSFECGLLQAARRGEVTVASAARRIAETRGRVGRVEAMLARLGEREAALPLRERVAGALTADSARRPADRTRARLAAAMAELERLLRRHFLGRTGRAGAPVR